MLNKLLCGLPAGAPVPSIEPTDDELDVCEDMLVAVLVNWEAIEGTSLDGLRETFLQREGRLERRPDGWHLRVQRKAVDTLVDQLPWSISVVYHRWMEGPVLVQW